MENFWIKFDRDFDPDLDLEPFEKIAEKLGCTIGGLEMVSDCGDAPDSFWDQLDRDTLAVIKYWENETDILSVRLLGSKGYYVEQRISSYP